MAVLPFTTPDSGPPDTPTALRSTIPVLDGEVYFNWGASGPSPEYVVDSVTAAQEYQEYRAAGDEGLYVAAMDVYDVAREAGAELFGTDPETVALTNSTTDGINRIATALDWTPGDTIVTTDVEHAAGRLPWTRLERVHDVEVRVIETDTGVIDLADLDRALEGADLLSVSAIDWLYGRVLPVAEMVDLAHENDALALIDAVQAPGQRAIDVEDWGADFVAAAGHKWLLGPWGAGLLYVAEDTLDRTDPAHVGFRGLADRSVDGYELRADARRFEIGTDNPGPYAGLCAAIETHESVGPAAIAERIEGLRERFVDGVPADRLISPPEEPTGLVTIAVDDPETVVEALGEESISVRSVPLPEAVRVSIHAVNTESEVEALLDELGRWWA
jgi:cysteine desulfurase/selenocysteine lyase